MKLSLRPYQSALVEQVSEAFRSGARSAVMQLGTGGGKTATASAILARTVARGRRAVFLAHLDSLLEDTSERLTTAGLRAGYVQAGRPSDPAAPIQVASSQTLHSRGERPAHALRARARRARPARRRLGPAAHAGCGTTWRPLLEEESGGRVA